MIERYSRPEMSAVWTEDSKYRRWLQVELTVSDVLAERGIVPAKAVEVIRERADFDVPGIQEIEREVKHDVIAFLTNVASYIGPNSRYVHYGMTSSDVLDTSSALQLKEAGVLLLEAMDLAIEALKDPANRRKIQKQFEIQVRMRATARARLTRRAQAGGPVKIDWDKAIASVEKARAVKHCMDAWGGEWSARVTCRA